MRNQIGSNEIFKNVFAREVFRALSEEVNDTEYKLVRMNRKSLSMSIDKDGVPLIKAPYSVSCDVINKFYNDRLDWVKARKTLYEEREIKRRETLCSEVDFLPLFGKNYPVTHESREYGFDWKSFNLPRDNFAFLKPFIVSMYRKIAAADIPKRVKKYASLVNVEPSAVKITSASTRWGSCSSKGSLNFSWKLIIAPDDVIDYVVVHELCHIKHMDHSPEFWSEVEKIIPDWQKKRDLLKDVQRLIAEKALE